MSNLQPPRAFLNDPDKAAAGTPENRVCEWMRAFAAGYACRGPRKLSGFRMTSEGYLKGRGHRPRVEVPQASWLSLLPPGVMAAVSISTGPGPYTRRDSRRHWFTFADLATHLFSVGVLVGLDVPREQIKDADLFTQAWTTWRLFQQWPAEFSTDVLFRNTNPQVAAAAWRWNDPLTP